MLRICSLCLPVTPPLLYPLQRHTRSGNMSRVSKSCRYFLLAQLYLQACQLVIKTLQNLLSGEVLVFVFVF